MEAFDYNFPHIVCDALGAHTHTHTHTSKYLVFSSVEINCSDMGQNNVMSSNERIAIWVAVAAIPKRTGATRRGESARPVTANYCNIGLVEGNPVLNSVPKVLETYICIVSEIISGKHIMYIRLNCPM